MNREPTADAIGLHERASATPSPAARRPSAESGAATARGASSVWTGGATTLREQEAWFAAIVTTPESEPAPVDAVSATLLIKPSRTLSALERIEIYRSSYHARLIECLVDDYPVLQHALGESVFETLCRAYIAAHPSTSFSLNSFGRHMAELCRSQPLALPGFASALASLEWAIVLAIHAPTASPLSLADLGQVPTERWPEAKLVPNPSLRILELEFSANAYLQAYRQGRSPKPLVDGPPEATEPRQSSVAVYRTGMTVWRMELQPAFVALVRALAEGQTLAAALGAVEPFLEGMTEAEAGQKVMTWFRHSVSSGLFASVVVD